MRVEDEILSIADQMEQLLPRFKDYHTLGWLLSPQDQATFKRLVLESKNLIDDALGKLNDFSMRLMTLGSGGVTGGPKHATITEAAEVLRGAVNHHRRQLAAPKTGASMSTKPPYVDVSQIAALQGLKGGHWDFSRLVQLCVELNSAHQQDSYLTIAMLVRAITDHVPPIFVQPNFQGVANNYAGQKSFKKSMAHLDGSLRNIADSALHTQIRQRESVPGSTQVNFGADLAELVPVV